MTDANGFTAWRLACCPPPPSDPHDALAYMLSRTPLIAEHDARYRLAADVVRAALDLLAAHEAAPADGCCATTVANTDAPQAEPAVCGGAHAASLKIISRHVIYRQSPKNATIMPAKKPAE